MRLTALERVLREEEHTDAEVARLGQLDAERRDRLCKELAGNLQQNTDAVTGLAGRVLACAVLQPLYNRERLVDNRVRRFAVDADDRTDAAGMFLLREKRMWAFYRARSCQKATALAAATFRESTPWDMGMRTV